MEYLSKNLNRILLGFGSLFMVLACGIDAPVQEEVMGYLYDEAGFPIADGKILITETILQTDLTDNNEGFREYIKHLAEALSDQNGFFRVSLDRPEGLCQIKVTHSQYEEMVVNPSLGKVGTFILQPKESLRPTGEATIIIQ